MSLKYQNDQNSPKKLTNDYTADLSQKQFKTGFKEQAHMHVLISVYLLDIFVFLFSEITEE